MASEPKSSGRKRSRPSDWWTVNQSSSGQQTEGKRSSKRKNSPRGNPQTSGKNYARNSKKDKAEIRDESTEFRFQDNNNPKKNFSPVTIARERDVSKFQKLEVKTNKNIKLRASDVDIIRTGSGMVSDDQLPGKNSKPRQKTRAAVKKSKDKTNNRKKSLGTSLEQNQGLVSNFGNSVDKLGVQNLTKTKLKEGITDNSSLSKAHTVEESTVSRQDLDFSRQDHISKGNHLVSHQTYHRRQEGLSTESEDELRFENGNKRSGLPISNMNFTESGDSQISLSEYEDQESSADILNISSLSSKKKLITVSNSNSRHVIKSKQRILPPLCIDRISKLLQDIQFPVILSFHGSRRRIQASTALKSISRSLVRKVPNIIHYPKLNQKNYKKFLDFKRTSDDSRSLEIQLTLALHSNKLLQSALSSELQLLREQRKKLTELETNSKRELALRSEGARKLHSVLRTEPDVSHISLDEDFEYEYEFREISETKDLDNEELSKLMKNICDHVKNIQNNVGQVSDISDSIARSKANLQDSLFDHFNGVEYEDIVTGIGQEI